MLAEVEDDGYEPSILPDDAVPGDLSEFANLGSGELTDEEVPAVSAGGSLLRLLCHLHCRVQNPGRRCQP